MNCNESARCKKTHKKILLSGSLLCFLIIFAGCSGSLPSRSELVLGTVCTISLYEQGSTRVYNSIFERLFEIEARMSAHITGNELDRINAASGISPVRVSADLFMLIETALYYASLSNGAFDPSIRPLVSLWDIGGENQRIPSLQEIENILPLVNWMDVELDSENSTVFLRKPGMALDLGGIAKGFAADEAAAIIRNAGIRRAVIDLGGDVITIGVKRDRSPWYVGIQDPLDSRGEVIGMVLVGQKTVVTSGVYQRFFINEDIHYHHIFSPSDGYPIVNNLLSVTIISENSIDADALSTAVFVMGYENGRALVQSLDGVSCIFVFDDQLVRITGEVDFVLTNVDYRIVYD